MSSLAEYYIPTTDELFTQVQDAEWTNLKQPQNFNPIYDEMFELRFTNERK